MVAIKNALALLGPSSMLIAASSIFDFSEGSLEPKFHHGPSLGTSKIWASSVHTSDCPSPQAEAPMSSCMSFELANGTAAEVHQFTVTQIKKHGSSDGIVGYQIAGYEDEACEGDALFKLNAGQSKSGKFFFSCQFPLAFRSGIMYPIYKHDVCEESWRGDL